MRRHLNWIAPLLLASACSAGDAPGPSRADAARFVAVEAGVVRDARTGLLWTARDSEREHSWHEAERRCRELELGGQETWRLATIEELQALFDAEQEQACGDWTCRVDPAVDLASPYQWSATPRGESRRLYADFRHGSELAPLLRPDLARGVLCTTGSGTLDVEPPETSR